MHRQLEVCEFRILCFFCHSISEDLPASMDHFAILHFEHWAHTWPGPKPGRAVRGFSQRIGDGVGRPTWKQGMARHFNLMRLTNLVTTYIEIFRYIQMLCPISRPTWCPLMHKAFYLFKLRLKVSPLCVSLSWFNMPWMMKVQKKSCWIFLLVTVTYLGDMLRGGFDVHQIDMILYFPLRWIPPYILFLLRHLAAAPRSCQPRKVWDPFPGQETRRKIKVSIAKWNLTMLTAILVAMFPSQRLFQVLDP